MQNAEDVAYKQNYQEKQAFPLVAPGLIGPDQGKGQAAPKQASINTSKMLMASSP